MSDNIPISWVEFSTDEYEWAHGKKPRGQGYWLFYLGDDTTIWDAVPYHGCRGDHGAEILFSEARSTIIRVAASRGIDRVAVCS